MPVARTQLQKQRRESQKPSFRLVQTIALVVISFGFGTVINTTSSLMKSPILDSGRHLSQEGPPNMPLRGPTIYNDGRRALPGPQRDMTNGRGWIYPEEGDLMKERLQAVERRIKSLDAAKTPGALEQQQQQQQQQPLAPPGQKLKIGQPRPELLGPGTTTMSVSSTGMSASVERLPLGMTPGSNPHQQQQPGQQGTPAPSFTRRQPKDLNFCREKVFVSQQKPVSTQVLDNACNDPAKMHFGVCHDLADFTGLAMSDVIIRMARLKQFHFEEEHLFWNPQTENQLAWYYSTSQSYLFANAIHGARTGVLSKLKKDIHEPVLDYSGGVGNCVLYLAIHRGMRCQYFGIGLIEKAFAQFRVAKRDLGHMVTFLSPWSESTGWRFDPIQALPRDGSLGAIIANDVLEHIPKYWNVVHAMVDSLRLGGVIVEQSPFADNPVAGTDTRIHVHHGGVSMAQAMGDRMVYRQSEGYWEKVRL